MLAVQCYYKYSLSEIMSEKNDYIRNKILELRNSELELLSKNNIESSIIKKYGYMSLEDICKIIDIKINEITSTSLFPSQIVICYPQIKEVKASRQYICDISGSEIKKGSTCIIYKMFMNNISDGYSYVLDKPWISELAYRDFYPRTINELDILNEKLINPFDYSDGYNYYDIGCRKGGYIKVRRLGR